MRKREFEFTAYLKIFYFFIFFKNTQFISIEKLFYNISTQLNHIYHGVRDNKASERSKYYYT